MLQTKRIALLALVVLLAACGPGARQKTLKTTFTAVESARASWGDWDEQHQAHIAKTAPLDVVDDRLAQYRKASEPIWKGFEAIYHALVLALLDDKTPLPTVIQAAEGLYRSIYDLRKESQ